TLTARPSRLALDKTTVLEWNAETVLRQALAALWLLSRYGGIGAKGRKGFGSLADLAVPGLAGIKECLAEARAFRGDRLPRGSITGVPALEQACVQEISLPWADPWFVLDQVGAARQSFATRWKHCREKMALGLPRNIHGPMRQPLRHQTSHTPPESLGVKILGQSRTRYAAPIHFHIGRSDGLVLRMIAFPSPLLPDPDTSRTMLENLLKHMAEEMEWRVTEYGGKGRRPAPAVMACVAAKPQLPPAGTPVEAVLDEERTKKGLWRARHDETGRTVEIQNSAAVPAERQPGDIVTLLISPNRQAFRWPEVEEASTKSPAGGAGPAKGKGKRGKR
ncbi:MAG: hypothetical protein K2Q10_00470, partial [Rhodospirillales bacterium]|nr:hypothetical protein [Rhodospirillales bacterium]